jgi:hypothetical protein
MTNQYLALYERIAESAYPRKDISVATSAAGKSP